MNQKLKMLLQINIRNFSNTACRLIRSGAQRIVTPVEPIITPEESKVEKEVKENKVKENELKIKKLKKGDKELSQLITFLRTAKKQRKEHENMIIVEGNQLIKDAVQAKFTLNKLIFSQVENVKEIEKDLDKNVELIKVPERELSFYSVLTTCPGLIAIFTKPAKIQPKGRPFPITIIADNVREPQNLGSIIRVSNALPIEKMILPKGSIDPWDTKSIRGSSGSIFHLPVESRADWNDINQSKGHDIVLIADNNTKKYNQDKIIHYDRIPRDLLLNNKITLIIGGETHGISDAAFEFASMRDYHVIKISLDQSVNSLNVSTALGIILFELRRLLIQNDIVDGNKT